MKKRMIAAMMGVVMAFSLTACGGGGSSSTTAAAATDTKAAESNGGSAAAAVSDDLPEMQITFASAQSSALDVSKYIVEKADEISAQTGGKLTLKVVFDGTLGSDSELVENCMAGNVPMILLSSSAMVSYVPEMAIFDMPMVYSSGKDAYEKIPNFKDTMNEIVNQKNMQILGLSGGTMRALTTNREIKTPDDFKGMNIRTLENTYHMAFWKNLGANPTPLAFSELYIGLQQGLVDAQDNPIQAVYAMKFHEVQKYYMAIPAFANVSCYMMNQKYYNDLPEEYKQILDDFVEDVNQYTWENLEATDAVTFEAIGDGLTILDCTDEITAALKEAAKPVWDMLRADLGDSLADAYLANAGVTQ